MKGICHCVQSGCGAQGGVERDTRTIRAHALNDKSFNATFLQQATEQAVDNQLDFITTQLSVATLTGELFSSSDQADDVEIIQEAVSARQQRKQLVQTQLLQLDDLESKSKLLADTVDDELAHPPTEAYLQSKHYPLRHLRQQCAQLQVSLEEIKSRAASVVAVKHTLSRRLDTIASRLAASKQDWKASRECNVSKHHNTYNTDHLYADVLPDVHPIVQLGLFLVLVCNITLGVSRRGGAFIFSILRYLLQLAFMQRSDKLSVQEQKILTDLPSDPRQLSQVFNLEGKYTIYAVCPNPLCHALYKPTFAPDSPDIPVYPTHCSHHRFPLDPSSKKCKELLVRPRVKHGHTVYMPIKPYLHFDFKDWFSRLLCRPGLEQQMDNSWASQNLHGDERTTMNDIFDGEILRTFCGPDGQLFSQYKEDEGHYVFSLSLDFFNPHGNRIAGKSVSIGLMSMVCLNLPPEIRYKPENMFLVGVIPGPREPPLTTLNHYISPLVDDLLEFWEPGVFLSRTHEHPFGRLIIAALICLVCDLPAARKTSGFVASSHNRFCAFCHCTRKAFKPDGTVDKNHPGINDINFHSWTRRTGGEWRSFADDFKNAATEKEQDSIVAAGGIRWSELLRLPYFDPSHFVIVDAMHNLFLGLIQEHFVGILGLKLTPPPEVEHEAVIQIPVSAAWKALEQNPQKSFQKLLRWLSQPMSSQLYTVNGMEDWITTMAGLNLKALELMCKEVGCEPVVKDARKKRFHRADYARGLLLWRRDQIEEESANHPDTLLCGHVLSETDIKAIRTDIANLVKPSWLTLLPSDFGSARHGKLKADQWRVFAATIAPISLIKQWGCSVESDDTLPDRSKILQVTMLLISAVNLASSRQASTRSAQLYAQHMQAYLAGIRDLFPEYRLHPNHHNVLHLHEYIQFFGPVHSWWTYPFERMIGMLQRILTNYKAGEYEETIARAFVRAVNLRVIALLSTTPEVIMNAIPIFQKLVNPDVRNTLLTDMLSFSVDHEDEDATSDDPIAPEMFTHNVQKLPDDLRCALDRHFGSSIQRISLLSHLRIEGLSYTPYQRHHGNSLVLIQGKSADVHARIEHVVQFSLHGRLKTIVAARHLVPATVSTNPFSQFPFIQASLFDSDLSPEISIYQTNAIKCHFAQTPFRWEGKSYVAAVSLSRVFEP